MFADVGDAIQLGQRESGNGGEAADLKRQFAHAEGVAEVAHGKRAVDEPSTVCLLRGTGAQIALGGGEVADDGLLEIGQSEDAFKAAVFVDDECERVAGFLEELERFDRGCGLEHVQGFPKMTGEVDDAPLAGCREDLPHVGDAQELVEVALGNGEAGIDAF